MYKRMKLWLSFLLCVCLLGGPMIPAAAGENTVVIDSVEGFLNFAENCRLDSYSEGLTVELSCDLDLTGRAFSGIPTFGGTFYGNGCTISGLSIRAEGSHQGLFRYVRSTASIQDLTIQGRITPGGSRSNVGGLAGQNEGRIVNCRFEGEVSGRDRVGGLVGCNSVTGVMEDCIAAGEIQGHHYVGGLAGENKGVIRRCENTAQVNTTAAENTVAIGDVSLDSVLDSESAITVTDIGGITGANQGVVRACENDGCIGYPQIGYNIGGIAGSQSGYLTDCSNRGEVRGRKEVGGIVGQMEPGLRLTYDEDTLQKLEREMGTMMGLTNQTMASAQGAIADVNSQLSALEGHVQSARDALDQMKPTVEMPEAPDADGPTSMPEVTLPDQDTMTAARNNLSSSLSALPGTMDGMLSSAQGALGSVSGSMQAMMNQMNVISDTIGSADQDLGGRVVDVSDEDTEADTTGKVENCQNYGSVVGDLNVGGIAGALSFESDLDPEADIEVSGGFSLNFEGEIRAVVLGCENYAAVTAHKQNAGGIAGRQSLGLLRGCVNRGDLEGESIGYVGGVVGRGDRGYIRASSARCRLSGSEYVGGIAGTATTVSDCRSMVMIWQATEKTGGILGSAENMSGEIEKNFYLPLGEDIGGADGISYDGSAQPVPTAEFFKLENVPEDFAQVTVRFVFGDGSEESFTLAYGEGLETSRIPAVPEVDGQTGYWKGLSEADLEQIVFDLTFEAVYDDNERVIQSTDLREDGRPILLVSSDFGSQPSVTLSEPSASAPKAASAPEAAGTILEAWDLTLTEHGETSTLRYLPAAEYKAQKLAEEDAQIWVRDASGDWREVAYTVDGSYLVFDIAQDEVGFCLVQTEAVSWLLYGLPAAGALVLAIVVGIVLRRRHRRK